LRPARRTTSSRRTSSASTTAAVPFAIYRSPDDAHYAPDDFCTHEHAHLADGLDHIIECPKHNGRFDYRTGEAKSAPICVDLKTYPVKVEGGKVLIDVTGCAATPTSPLV
jgi:3-phenylpropionate/trans-cinnamate dioxygenase ferredoxin subunit